MKFEDCVDCRFKQKPWICAECDFGEQFEPIQTVADLNFDDADNTEEDLDDE
jgi:hypothetical protein